MADETGIDDGGAIDTTDDKTSETKNEYNLDDLKDEDDLDIDEKKEDAPDKSEIIQKKKWRDRYLKSQETIRKLESEAQTKKESKQPTESEDKEIAAQRYIREQARKEYESLIAEQKAREEKVLEEFQDKLDATLEDYPDFTEDQILGICEEFDVEPAIAAKILKRQSETKTKPKNPTPKRAPTSAPPKEEVKSKATDMYGLAQDIKRQIFGNKS